MLGNLVHDVQVKSFKYFLARRGLGRASVKSLANSALNTAELKLGRSWLRSNPDYIQIEPTTSCNLTCGACGLQNAWSELKERASFITRDTFSRTVPFLDTARLVILQGWGESLLHPDFLWMVEVAKSRGAMVGVLTNGVLITEEMATALVDLDIDLIGISVDAATEQSYRRIRGGDFRKVEAGLAYLAARKRERRRMFPVLQLSFAVMKQNLYEISTLLDLAARYGVDEVILNNLIVYTPDLAGQSVFDIPSEVEAVHRATRLKAEELGILFFYDGVKRREPEPECPYRTFSVLSDGSVGPCGAQRVLLGNLYDAPLRSLWNSPEYVGMRQAYAAGRLPHTCQHCPNFTNAEEDHVQPDMSYVEETLGRRRWDLAASRSQCGSSAKTEPAPTSDLLGIGR